MRISSILNDRYRIIENIEMTSYGSIDIVECQNTGKKYVSKSISKDANPIRIHQFRTELDVLSQLNDPYIPELLDAWETETEFVLVESYIQGISLNEVMKERISRKMKYKIVLECMERIKMVHQIGYLYLDLKPENIMIYNQNVYLIDFNSCILKDSTKAYMASEENISIELNKNVSKKESSDIYALGSLIQRLYSKDIWLKPFIGKCMKQKPSLRYQNIQSVKKGFQRIFLWKKIVRASLMLSLSVFIVLSLFHRDSNALEIYQNNANPNTFFQAYLYTMNQKNGSKNEKLNQNLYQWIDEGLVDSSLYKDQKTLKFLVQQAIQSENPMICQFIETKVDFRFQKDNPYDYVLLQMYANQENQISYSFIEEYFLYTQTLKESEEIVIKVDQIVTLLINEKIVLEDKEIQILIDLVHSNYKKMDEENACLFLEYCLFLRSRNIQVEIPKGMNDFFEKNDQWNELYELYNTSKD